MTTLAGIILIGGFALLMLLRVPVSFAMLLATLASALVMDTNLSVMIRQMMDGANNFSLLSIPFFIVMGEFMGAGGRARHLMDVLTDAATLLCGLFMLVVGGQRTMKLFSLTGTMPITGISTAWQYLPIPVAGFVMTFDSVLFLTGIIRRDDLLYSEPEIDFTDEEAAKRLRREGEAP